MKKPSDFKMSKPYQMGKQASVKMPMFAEGGKVEIKGEGGRTVEGVNGAKTWVRDGVSGEDVSKISGDELQKSFKDGSAPNDLSPKVKRLARAVDDIKADEFWEDLDNKYPILSPMSARGKARAGAK